MTTPTTAATIATATTTHATSPSVKACVMSSGTPPKNNPNTIGKTFVAGQAETREIVGVVRNISDGLGEVSPMFYRPLGTSSATGPARDVGVQGGDARRATGI